MNANSASDPGSAPEKSKSRKLTCSITGKEYARHDLVQLDAFRPSLADRIRQDHPDLTYDALISKAELAQYRTKYVEELLKAEHGDLTELDRQVAVSLATHETLAENIEAESDGLIELAVMSAFGTFETCRPAPKMSVHRGRPEFFGEPIERRF